MRDINEKIGKALDNKLYVCDTVNCYILLNKLNQCGTGGQANKWFKNFLTQKYQYINIKECSSKKLKVTHGVSQESVLGPLLFLLYINGLHKTMEHSSVHYFADDTNILFVNKSLKKINHYNNCDLKLLCQCIRSNNYI